MARNFNLSLALLIGCGALAGCGGGGGGGGASSLVSTPPPPPTPPPTTPPGPRPLTYTGPIGLQSSQPFATFALAQTYSSDSNGSNFRQESAPNQSQAVEFRYVEADNEYEILIPNFERGRLDTIYHNGTVCANGSVCAPISTGSRVTVGTTAATQNILVDLPVPGSNYLPVLTYTHLGEWRGERPDPANPGRTLVDEGLFAYGIATAEGDVPTTGSASYTARVRGSTTGTFNYVDGSATLLFNFAGGTLTGNMRAEISSGWEETIALGQYDFTQTVFGVGSTTFAGKFIVPGSTADSFFEGRFNGPRAAELMARWQAPYLDPGTNSWGTMFGVWVGKKQ